MQDRLDLVQFLLVSLDLFLVPFLASLQGLDSLRQLVDLLHVGLDLGFSLLG